MSPSIGEFCKRLAEIEVGKLNITWTSTLRTPGVDDEAVLKVSGELLEDKIIFTERSQIYGSQHKFEDMVDHEVVTSSRVSLSVVRGTEIFVESLL